nr:collagen alpha-1(III) chain-like [Manis javanica]
MGGRRRGRAGSSERRRLGGAGPAAGAPETRRPGRRGPRGRGARSTPGLAAEARGRTRGSLEDPASLLGWSGAERGAGPAVLPRGRPVCLGRFGISEAKHAHARLQVRGRSPSWPAPRQPAAVPEDRAGQEPGRRRARPARGAPAAQGPHGKREEIR